MKNILFLLSLLITLVGCEKYELTSDPQLNLNGWWDVAEVNLVISQVNSDKQVIVSQEEQATVGNYTIIETNSDEYITIINNFSGTDIKRRFDVYHTQWEFDYGSLRVIDSIGEQTTTVDFPCTYCTEASVMEIGDFSENRYTFSIDTYGAMPSNKLTLTSEEFITNNNGIQIESYLVIILHRI